MKKQKIKKLLINIILMLTLASLCLFYSSWNLKFVTLMQSRFNIISIKDNLLVHFISVGEADAVAINLPDGKVVVIDTGWRTTNVTLSDYISNNVLNNSLDDTIDYLLFSHADLDHSGGGRKILKEFEVEKVFLPSVSSETEQYVELVKNVKNKCDYELVEDDSSISGQNYKIDIINSPLKNSTNNSSCIVKISYLNKSFLFTGDIDKKVEELLIEKYDNFLDVDVLKVAHHGSKTSTSVEFLNVATPEFAVISVGNNSYGHPTSEVLENLDKSGAKTLRTDVEGNIVFVVGENYKLKPNFNNIYFTKFSLDYRILILVIDVMLFINVVVITISIFKKPKKRRKNLN